MDNLVAVQVLKGIAEFEDDLLAELITSVTEIAEVTKCAKAGTLRQAQRPDWMAQRPDRMAPRPDWMTQRPGFQERQHFGKAHAVNPLSDDAVAKAGDIHKIKDRADVRMVQCAADLILLAEKSLIKRISGIFRLQGFQSHPLAVKRHPADNGITFRRLVDFMNIPGAAVRQLFVRAEKS